ncbi:hypothetical protein TanjilG_31468 [Lupinus angustifolius]|uniref:Uncharacterized protein n=1 Tax=Lupinus angustifolius TaxID=3871 RepID=A0A4P1RU73_LUPAN|nr:hypothetical protein TanjilG_31468 [Lupinus angustifolius]
MDKEIVINVSENSGATNDKCFEGELHKAEDGFRVKEILAQEGIFDIQATFMGGNLVLLKGVGKMEVVEVLCKEEGWFNNFFKCLNSRDTIVDQVSDAQHSDEGEQWVNDHFDWGEGYVPGDGGDDVDVCLTSPKS